MTRMITQTQISAYERCKRFYYLKYVENLAWPVEENVSDEIQRGSDFHLLARQLIMGLDPSDLLFPSDDRKMQGWVDNFCRKISPKNYDVIYPEKEASALHSGVLWLGKFDALAVKDDRITIYDWKTTGHPADPDGYLRSPQTKLYRFLAKMCAPRIIGSGLHGLPAENIMMVYWFPEHPDVEICLPYSESAFREDLTWLQYKAAEMSSEDPDDYPMTEKSVRCRFCKFESCCFPRKAGPPEEPGISCDEGSGQIPEEAFQPELFFESPADENEPESANF